MSLFGKKNVPESREENPDAPIKVLGGGCARCQALESATRAALEALGMDTAIEHVTDYARIAAYGVMSTPALVVDGRVLSCGRVLDADEVAALLREARG